MLNKEEILQNIAWAAGISKEQAEKAIKALSETVKQGLSDKDGNPTVGATQKVAGLGTWEVREVKAKSGANPQVSSAKSLIAKAEAGETVDADKLTKAKEIMEKVAAGDLKETIETPAGQKLGFRPEKALKTWVNPTDSEDDAE